MVLLCFSYGYKITKLDFIKQFLVFQPLTASDANWRHCEKSAGDSRRFRNAFNCYCHV